jgi:transposase InsO family protein
MPVASWSGAKYVFTLTDDYSRKVFVFFLKSKDEVRTVFCDFKARVEKETDLFIKSIRTDNGSEYVNKLFQDFLKHHGIQHQVTVPYNPQMNGVAERVNRTLVEKARCLMQEAKCDERMWAEAINTAAYLKNRSHKSVPGQTPEERWTGEKVDLRHLKTFGCVAYAHVPREKRTKLDPKAIKYILLVIQMMALIDCLIHNTLLK